jgi:hypothetical protein
MNILDALRNRRLTRGQRLELKKIQKELDGLLKEIADSSAILRHWLTVNEGRAVAFARYVSMVLILASSGCSGRVGDVRPALRSDGPQDAAIEVGTAESSVDAGRVLDGAQAEGAAAAVDAGAQDAGPVCSPACAPWDVCTWTRDSFDAAIPVCASSLAEGCIADAASSNPCAFFDCRSSSFPVSVTCGINCESPTVAGPGATIFTLPTTADCTMTPGTVAAYCCAR